MSMPVKKMKLGGKIRKLCLPMPAMAEYEEKTGKSIFAFMFNAATGSVFKATEIRDVLWASLLKEYPDIDEDEVNSMIHSGNIMEITEVLVELYESSTPESKDTDGDSKNTARPTG